MLNLSKPNTKMSGEISVNIPLKGYLKKYLLKKYGNSYTVNRTDWLGKYLVDLLDKQYRKKGSFNELDFYTIIVPSTIIKEVGFDMSAVKMKHFESMIDKVFRSELETYIEVSLSAELYTRDASKYYKQNTLQAMEQFLKRFDIYEDDLKLESLYRDYARKKKPVETLAPIRLAV